MLVELPNSVVVLSVDMLKILSRRGTQYSTIDSRFVQWQEVYLDRYQEQVTSTGCVTRYLVYIVSGWGNVDSFNAFITFGVSDQHSATDPLLTQQDMVLATNSYKIKSKQGDRTWHIWCHVIALERPRRGSGRNTWSLLGDGLKDELFYFTLP